MAQRKPISHSVSYTHLDVYKRQALQGAIFSLEFEIAYKLQSIEYQVDRLIAYRCV